MIWSSSPPTAFVTGLSMIWCMNIFVIAAKHVKWLSGRHDTSATSRELLCPMCRIWCYISIAAHHLLDMLSYFLLLTRAVCACMMQHLVQPNEAIEPYSITLFKLNVYSSIIYQKLFFNLFLLPNWIFIDYVDIILSIF